MSVEKDTYTALSEDNDVSQLVGSKIYPDESKQNDVFPYVVYQLISSVPVESPEEDEETNMSVMDIGCYGSTYEQSKELAEAVRSAMILYFGSCVIEDSRDERDPVTRKKFVLQTYRIWHDEDFP